MIRHDHACPGQPSSPGFVASCGAGGQRQGNDVAVVEHNEPQKKRSSTGTPPPHLCAHKVHTHTNCGSEFITVLPAINTAVNFPPHPISAVFVCVRACVRVVCI
jgi:hypothetical protein